MKIKPSLKRMILMSLLVFLLCGIVLFTSCLSLFCFQKWTFVQPLIIGLYAISCTIIFIVCVTRNHYILNTEFLEVHRLQKTLYFHYKDIIYIDTSKGNKNNTITIMLNKGLIQYLVADEKGQLYDELISRCHNLKSKEEIKKIFPNAKI